MRWIFLVLFSTQVSAAHERGMFNACNDCRSWAPVQTAHLLKALDNGGIPYELWSINSVVILSPPKENAVRCYDYFAIFFDDLRSCQDFSRSLKIKCELTVTTATGN